VIDYLWWPSPSDLIFANVNVIYVGYSESSKLIEFFASKCFRDNYGTTQTDITITYYWYGKFTWCFPLCLPAITNGVKYVHAIAKGIWVKSTITFDSGGSPGGSPYLGNFVKYGFKDKIVIEKVSRWI
jgi:hypothetical protein